MDASKYDIKRLDHLGIVADYCKEIGLKEFVDMHFFRESHNSHITNGVTPHVIPREQRGISLLLHGLEHIDRYKSSQSGFNVLYKCIIY